MDKIRQYFQSLESLSVDESGNAASNDLRLAVGVLLAEAARSSGSESADEAREMFRGLEREFGLTADQVHKLIELSHGSMRDMSTLAGFIDEIAIAYNDSQKQKILAMVWKVLIADGVVDRYESTFAVDVRTKLGLTLEQSVHARKLAEGGYDLSLEKSALPEDF